MSNRLQTKPLIQALSFIFESPFLLHARCTHGAIAVQMGEPAWKLWTSWTFWPPCMVIGQIIYNHIYAVDIVDEILNSIALRRSGVESLRSTHSPSYVCVFRWCISGVFCFFSTVHEGGINLENQFVWINHVQPARSICIINSFNTRLSLMEGRPRGSRCENVRNSKWQIASQKRGEKS